MTENRTNYKHEMDEKTSKEDLYSSFYDNGLADDSNSSIRSIGKKESYLQLNRLDNIESNEGDDDQSDDKNRSPDSDDYDTGLEDCKTDIIEKKKREQCERENVDIGHVSYKEACGILDTSPIRLVLQQLREREIRLQHVGLNTKDTIALSYALLIRSEVEQLRDEEHFMRQIQHTDPCGNRGSFYNSQEQEPSDVEMLDDTWIYSLDSSIPVCEGRGTEMCQEIQMDDAEGKDLMPSKAKELPETYSVQCQVPYNLVKRRAVGIQEKPLMVEKETQTSDSWLYFSADRPKHQPPSHEQSANDSMDSYISGVSNDSEWTPDDFEHSFDDSTVSSDHDDINVAKERKFIVFESNLDELFSTCVLCSKKLTVNKKVCGTFVQIETFCKTCIMERKWKSQPQSGSLAIGNLVLSAAIMFSGSCQSKAINIFKHAGICCFCPRTYSYLQELYLVPSIMSVWQSQQVTRNLDIVQSGRPVKLGGDARCDSPGHTAKFGSYTVMDLETSKVLDIQLVQSNEVKNSYSMELEGLKRCLQYLKDEKIPVSHLITDRHMQVKKHMREEQGSIIHWFDVWHVAKGVYKKLDAAGKKKGCEKVKLWARSISNHLYWCAATSEGDGELAKQKWLSIMNHVQNIHQGHGDRFHECQHGDIEDRLWMKQGFKPYEETRKVVESKFLVKDVMKLSPAQQTSSLESFHKIICQFAPKFVHYSHPQMQSRLCLAALHFNENSSRDQAVRMTDGKPQYLVSYPKGREGGVAKEVKVKQTYDYVDELMEEVILRRELCGSFRSAKSSRLMEETTWPSAGNGIRHTPTPLAHSTPHRLSKQQVVQNRTSRFGRT